MNCLAELNKAVFTQPTQWNSDLIFNPNMTKTGLQKVTFHVVS